MSRAEIAVARTMAAAAGTRTRTSSTVSAVTARTPGVGGAPPRLQILPPRPSIWTNVDETVTNVIAGALRRAEHRGARSPCGRARIHDQAPDRGAGHERGRGSRRPDRPCGGPAQRDAGRPERQVDL